MSGHTSGPVQPGCGLAENQAVLETVAQHIIRKRQCGQPLLVFVTGMDCSGKTLFADQLADLLARREVPTQLIHGDDFHNEKALRYVEHVDPHEAYYRYSLNQDKLVTEVFAPIRRDKRLDRQFSLLDLATDQYSIERRYTIYPETVVLVEGVFLLADQFRDYRDFVIYLRAPLETLLSRARTRDSARLGEEVEDRYLDKYLLAQSIYESMYPPAEIADLIVDNPAIGGLELTLNIVKYGPATCTKVATSRRSTAHGGYEAVVFDLWETLIPLPSGVKLRTRNATAEILRLDLEQFDQLWSSTRAQRETMELESYLYELCDRLRVDSKQAIDRILKVRRDAHGSCFAKPCPDSVTTLKILRRQGIRTGILSNCTSDVAAMLQGSELAGLADEFLLSALSGLMKPNPAFFTLMATKLGVDPERCLYVGDGSDHELLGAQASRMTPVLLRTGKPIAWDGAAIDRIAAVIGLVMPPF